MILLPEFKTGNTFSLSGIVLLPDGEWTAICHFRDKYNTLQKSIPVIIGDKITEGYPIGLTVEADETVDWVTGTMDIRFEDESGAVLTTNTITLPVVRSETRV